MPRGNWDASVARRAGDVHGRPTQPAPQSNGAAARSDVSLTPADRYEILHESDIDYTKAHFEKVSIPPSARSEGVAHAQQIVQLTVGGDAYIIPIGSLDEKKAKANANSWVTGAKKHLAGAKFAVRCFELRGRKVIGIWRVE